MNVYEIRVYRTNMECAKVTERMTEGELRKQANALLECTVVEAVVASLHDGLYRVFDRGGERIVDFA